MMLGGIDQRLFLFLNGLHTGWLDTVMVAITGMWPWIPIYILLFYMVFKQYGKRGWWVLLAVCLVILCTDQLSAHVCKPLFHRLRPCFNPELEGLVHLSPFPRRHQARDGVAVLLGEDWQRGSDHHRRQLEARLSCRTGEGTRGYAQPGDVARR